MKASIAVCLGVVILVAAPAGQGLRAQATSGAGQGQAQGQGQGQGQAQAQGQGQAAEQAPTLEQILDQQREIQAALQRNDPRVAHLDSFRRSRIKLNQETVFRRAEGYQSISEMKADDQLALFNALKRIESLMVKRNEDDSMVCERVAIVGTRRYEMACMTRAERDDRAESAKKALMERQACTTAGCIGD